MTDKLRDAARQDAIPDPVAYNGWVLREVLFDNGEPVGHRASSNRVMLTDEEIVQLSLEWSAETNDWASHIDFARAVIEEYEKKNGIKRG